MIKVKLTKLIDNTFNGNHPNGIYEGYIKIGMIPDDYKPTIGERFYITTFSTSPVTTEMNENGIFNTTYSTYKLEYI